MRLAVDHAQFCCPFHPCCAGLLDVDVVDPGVVGVFFNVEGYGAGEDGFAKEPAYALLKER